MQHKKELGNKYVTGVRVLRNDEQVDDTIEEADLVFYIADVPPEKSIPDAPSQNPPQGLPQSVGLVAPQLVGLSRRETSGYSMKEHLHGRNNILRVHKIMAG